MQIQLTLRALALTAASGVSLGAQTAVPKADLIVVNGTVYTVDDAHPRASAFAVRNGRIVFVGSDREARMLAGSATRVIDARGNTVIPRRIRRR